MYFLESWVVAIFCSSFPRSVPKVYQSFLSQSLAVTSMAPLTSSVEFVELVAVGSFRWTLTPSPSDLTASLSISSSFSETWHFLMAPGSCIMLKASAVPHMIFCLPACSFGPPATRCAMRNMMPSQADWKKIRLSPTHWCRSTWMRCLCWLTLTSSSEPLPKKPLIIPADTFARRYLSGGPSGRSDLSTCERKTLRRARPRFTPKAWSSAPRKAATAAAISLIITGPFATRCSLTYSALRMCSTTSWSACFASLWTHLCTMSVESFDICFRLMPSSIASAGADAIMPMPPPGMPMPPMPIMPCSRRLS
mmetsp:Transcript_86462/g.222704  ORF Transcript_86462/g.222704 Transcript_86462/m.222704 type:complete len:308 (+) Transcript_86462:348-1271(+)